MNIRYPIYEGVYRILTLLPDFLRLLEQPVEFLPQSVKKGHIHLMIHKGIHLQNLPALQDPAVFQNPVFQQLHAPDPPKK